MDDPIMVGREGYVKLEDFRERKQGFVDEWMKNEKGEEDEINEEVVLCIVILGWMNGRVKSNLGVILYTFPLRKIDDVSSIGLMIQVHHLLFVFLQLHHGILYPFRHLLTNLFIIHKFIINDPITMLIISSYLKFNLTNGVSGTFGLCSCPIVGFKSLLFHFFLTKMFL